jgi:predicted kinase
MSAPLICHFLIGPPGSGKSTFAAELAKQGGCRIVSTDQIRETLYGDPSIQGDWSEIEAQVLSQIREAIAANQPVIYDATNAKRVWRMTLLMQLQLDPPPTPPCKGGEYQTPLSNSPLEGTRELNRSSNSPLSKGGWGGSRVNWMAWHFTTPLQTCKAWNRNRERKVPDVVIESMFKSLQNMPPVLAEGFAAVNTVPVTPNGFDMQAIQEKIQRLRHTLTNGTNRPKPRKITRHRYSRLLDFERLLHLIAVIIRYPGIGTLHSTAPRVLEKIFDRVPNFVTPLDEICGIIYASKGAIYAEPKAVAADLQWLEQNGLIGSANLKVDLTVPPLDDENALAHAYSDIEPFKRLLLTIRWILHHPFLPTSGNSSLVTLADTLKAQGIINRGRDKVRQDIEKVLIPYQILPDFPQHQGYFAGTGILSRQELRRMFALVQAQAKNLHDPMALATYEMFRERMSLSNLEASDVYPVRVIGDRFSIESETLPFNALSNNVEKLEEAIEQGELLELKRTPGTDRLDGDEAGLFLALPLQLVFHDLAWYLGFECTGGTQENLFQLERLDRLFFGQPQGKRRDKQAQLRSLKKLRRLYEASAGVFLGYSASDQQQYLSPNKSERSAVEVTVELWFNDSAFRLIAEGTKRFPPKQMKMSPPLGGRVDLKGAESILPLPQTKDPEFPYRFQIKLPKWSLMDVDLLQWIVGFGGSVKVVSPPELVARIKAIGEEIYRVYRG